MLKRRYSPAGARTRSGHSTIWGTRAVRRSVALALFAGGALVLSAAAQTTPGADGARDDTTASAGHIEPLARIPSRQSLFDVPEAQRGADWYENASLRGLANQDLAEGSEFALEGATLGSARCWSIAASLSFRSESELPASTPVLERTRRLDTRMYRTHAYYRWLDRHRETRLGDPDRIVELDLYGPWPKGLGPSGLGAVGVNRDRASRERWFSAQRSTLIRALTVGPGESADGRPRPLLIVTPYERSLEELVIELEDASRVFPASQWLFVVLRSRSKESAPTPGSRDTAETPESRFLAIDRPVVLATVEGAGPWSRAAFGGQRVAFALSTSGRVIGCAPPGMPTQLLSLFVD